MAVTKALGICCCWLLLSHSWSIWFLRWDNTRLLIVLNCAFIDSTLITNCPMSWVEKHVDSSVLQTFSLFAGAWMQSARMQSSDQRDDSICSNMCSQDVNLTVEVGVICASSRVSPKCGAGEPRGQVCLLVGLWRNLGAAVSSERYWPFFIGFFFCWKMFVIF